MPLLVDRPALWDVGYGMGYGTLFAGLIRDFAYRKNLFHKRTFMKQVDSGTGTKDRLPLLGMNPCRISV